MDFTQIWSHILPTIRWIAKKRKGLHSILIPHSNLVQNLTRQPELFRAPLGPGPVYPLNPPLVGPVYDQGAEASLFHIQ